MEKGSPDMVNPTKAPRVFVRAVTGEYNLTEELRRLRERPRVVKGSQEPFHGGPQHWNKDYMEPGDGLGQTLHIHLEEWAPGGVSQRHGHVNEAVFYILDGEGTEVHDGIKYDWKAGEVAIVHNNCVHQHFNRSETKPARALVMKTKPMFLFMNMLFQKTVVPGRKDPTAHGEGYVPRLDDHPWSHDRDHDEHEHAHDHHHEGSH
jgi:quercetin dioxygenase-like cupin family protein